MSTFYQKGLNKNQFTMDWTYAWASKRSGRFNTALYLNSGTIDNENKFNLGETIKTTASSPIS